MLGWLAVTVTVMVLFTAGTSWAAGSGEVDAGRQVFDANCAMCHGNDAGGMMGMHPSLRGAVERLSRDGVDVAIRNGRDTEPPMPAFEGRLSDRQIDDVVAYLDSLPVGPRNFGPDTRDRGMMGRGMAGSGWMFAAGVLVGLLVALAGAGAVLLVRGRSGGVPRDPARRELDRRYASGELSREAYLQRRDDLRADDR